jgi:ABC-type spermidine/putrescine transport system permease subunit II
MAIAAFSIMPAKVFTLAHVPDFSAYAEFFREGYWKSLAWPLGMASDTVANLVWTFLTIAAVVTAISLLIGFFGALPFARYQWRFRRLYQKLILLPIF